MDGAIDAVLKPLIRGALIYLVWCYGGFIIGPLAIAWEQFFSIPLWIFIACAGGAPLLIELGMVWVATAQVPVVVSASCPGLASSGFVRSVAVQRPSRRSRRRVRSRAVSAPHRLERFGRTRLR